MKTWPQSLILVVLCHFLAGATSAQNVESVPPVVVKTVPEAGTKGISPGVTELRVTFSKAMNETSWSWVTAWKDSTPEMVGKPHFEDDGKTCVVQVKLEANRTYAYWINTEKFRNFKDAQKRPAVPYLLVFQTKDQ